MATTMATSPLTKERTHMASPATTTSTWGILAEFDSAAEIFHACEKVRDAGFAHWDAHTPFPVHGLDDAMGLKASKLPWVVLVVGLSGTITGTALQYWVHNYAYKLVISGKPLFAWPAYVPIIFEMSILFSAFATIFSIMGFCRLPRWNHPIFGSARFEKASDDKFFISIESADPKFEATRTAEFLKGIGAKHVELVEEEA